MIRYAGDPPGAAACDFQFQTPPAVHHGEKSRSHGPTLRLRAPGADRCRIWVQALSLLAGDRWAPLAAYFVACAPPPPTVLRAAATDGGCNLLVRPVAVYEGGPPPDYFVIRTSRQGQGIGELAERPPPPTLVLHTPGKEEQDPDGGTRPTPLRLTVAVPNGVDTTVAIHAGTHGGGEGPPATFRVMGVPRPPGEPRLLEVLPLTEAVDVAFELPDPGGDWAAAAGPVASYAFRAAPSEHSAGDGRLLARVPTLPGYGDAGQPMRAQVLGLPGGCVHVLTLTATGASGLDGPAVAFVVTPKLPKGESVVPPPPGVGGADLASEAGRRALLDDRVGRAREPATFDSGRGHLDAFDRAAAGGSRFDSERSLDPLHALAEVVPEIGERPLPPPPPRKAVAKQVVVTTGDYLAARPDELSFRAGERIVVVKDDGAWWAGYLHGAPGRTGLFPSNHVEPEHELVHHFAPGEAKARSHCRFSRIVISEIEPLHCLVKSLV
jgi:hypothetical protein